MDHQTLLNQVNYVEDLKKEYRQILDQIKEENNSFEIQKEHKQNYLKMLNQKIAMTYQENKECLKEIENVNSQLLLEEQKTIKVIDKCDNNSMDYMERKYAKEFKALSEKITYYKDVFQVDIDADKGSKKIILTFINADQKVFLEYHNIKNIKASVDDFSDLVIEEEKDSEINKIIWQFNQADQKQLLINDLILNIIDVLKGI